MALTVESLSPRRPGADPEAVARIEGPAADAYVERLRRAIRAARTNRLFPPAAPLRAHLGFLGPGGSEQLYPDVVISLQSGLPVAREIYRVKIDRDLAAEFLSGAAGRPAPRPGSRMQRKIAYYGRLARAGVLPISRIRVELRQQLPEQDLALFRVTLDRFDIGFGQFARYTILLGQRDSFWRRRQVIVDDDELAAPTEGFRRVVSRFAAHEAEVAFLLLSRRAELEVQDVRRCRVGPLLLPGMRVGGPLERLLDPRRGPCAAGGEPPWILCFPEDRAGLDVAADSDRDPLARLMSEALGPEAGAALARQAARLGYRVAKSRKFVCPEPLRDPLARLCRDEGAPSIVRCA